MRSYHEQNADNTVNIPKELRNAPQWVAWRRSGRHKEPISPRTGRTGDATDPDTWATYEDATSRATADGLDGMGFVVSADDPYTGVDIDGCIEDGEVKSWAMKIVYLLGSYTEITPSGTGLRVWVKGSKPGNKCKTDYHGGAVEIYDQERFFTITGDVFHDRPIEERQDALDTLYWLLWPKVSERPEARSESRHEASGKGFAGTDQELIEKARTNEKTGTEFKKLFDHGSIAGYKSPSEAEAALFRMLAYWTGSDLERMERLARRSALERPKWNERRAGESWLRYSLKRISDLTTKSYDSGAGDKLKERVRIIADSVRERACVELDPDSSKAKVLDLMLQTAAALGRYKSGSVEFNANQEQIAGEIGMSQRGVSKIIKWLVENAYMARTEQGSKKTGRNSSYILRAGSTTYTNGSTTYTDTVGSDGSTTYLHRGAKEPQTVSLSSRTNGSTDRASAEPVRLPKLRSENAGIRATAIEQEWSASDNHPLDCECITCSSPAPKYVKYHQPEPEKIVEPKPQPEGMAA